MSTFLFCPLASQHMPCCSMASPRTTSSQSYPVSSTVSVCLLIAMPHKTCSTPVHSFVCMKHSLSWASLWSLSPVARSWTAPVVEHSMAASDHAWLHSFSMVMPSLSMKIVTWPWPQKLRIGTSLHICWDMTSYKFLLTDTLKYCSALFSVF
jgi:hypothetical protein